MVIKGKSRSGASQLAAYLQRLGKNERIEILEHNSPHATLSGSFRDWEILAEATQGEKSLYHAQINPDARYTMTPQQWERAADVLEAELGIKGHPRAIVLHERDGREHIHVVWQRCDVDTMTLASDSWNYLAHEHASMALEKEFGHEHVPGKHAKRDRDQQPDFPRQETTQAEQQQAERTGLDPDERKAQIAALKSASDSAQAFKTALEEAGYILARGDRGYTLVDEQGDHFNLARQLKEKIAQVNAFMADVPLDTLPALEDAKEQAKALTTSQVHTPTQQPPPEAKQTPAPEEPSYKMTQAEIETLRQDIANRHAQEVQKLKDFHAAEIDQLRRVLDLEISEKLANTDALQTAERNRKVRELFPERVGLDKFIETIKGKINPTGKAEDMADREKKWDALIDRQEQQRMDRRVQLDQSKEQDINDLKERHAQKIREEKAKSEADLTRYIRQEEAARKLLAELKQDQRQKELRQQRDGPEPPTPTR